MSDYFDHYFDAAEAGVFMAPTAQNGFSADRGGEYRAIATAYTSGTANVMLAAPNDY